MASKIFSVKVEEKETSTEAARSRRAWTGSLDGHLTKDDGLGGGAIG